MLKILLLSSALALSACTTIPTDTGVTPVAYTQKDFDSVLLKATLVVDQVTVQANNAYKAKFLKQGDAENVLLAVKAARDGLNIAKTLDPISGISKANVTIATMGAMQLYLATYGVK